MSPAAGRQAWRELPFLELSKPNRGWADWQQWFAGHDVLDGGRDYRYFNNYVYLPDAAAAGKGIALGWRGLIERHFESGVLRGPGLEFTEFERGIHAVMTGFGKDKPPARQCLDGLVRLAGDPRGAA